MNEKSVNLSAPFIRRPVATSLLTLAIVLVGILAFRLLPVSPLPQVDFPTISVSAQLPGASPETMASAVATPLERMFGRIAGVTEMTSSSAIGSSNITLQFDLNRDINAAARDVQAAINASMGNLPANLPSRPSYRKVNPADAPVLILALTSDVMTQPQMYDIAESILSQKISQVAGVGQVTVGGSSRPGVRVELNPMAVNKYGIDTAQVRKTLAYANANAPKGQLNDNGRSVELRTTDQLFKAADYQKLVVTYHNGAPVRVGDLGDVTDSQENIRNAGRSNGKPSIMLIIFRQPGANIIDAVDGVYSILPQLRASVPPSVNINVMMDRTTTIRASIRDVERTLVFSILLVVLVVFLFLRNATATSIPGVVVPLSLLGTFAGMYALGYSIDNLSLMALTISTGFVVDDAIVVIENVTRYLEMGMKPMDAALKGASEVGFTVLSMSTSLIAVFMPILLMGGIVGRLFREFAVTLSMAIAVSMVVSLTATPMMCSVFLKSKDEEKHGEFYEKGERVFNWLLDKYSSGLRYVLDRPGKTMLVLLLTVVLNICLYVIVPKGFFPQQDVGQLNGSIVGEQDISFQAMREKMEQFVTAVRSDKDVVNVVAFCGGSSTNKGNMFVTLTDPDKRKISIDQIIARIRRETSKVTGARVLMQAVQDIKVGGRSAGAQYQYTLQAQDLITLNSWAPKIMERLQKLPMIVDLNTDQQNSGLAVAIDIDRDTAARLGLTAADIDNALYDAFGQRQVSTMYMSLNQYHVVMEAAPEYWQNPDTLRTFYATTTTGKVIPLSSFIRFKSANSALAVNHQGQFPAVTLSFNLRPGAALGDAVNAITKATRDIGMPATMHGTFMGTAQAFQSSLANEPYLILAAVCAVYIVLGVLYESYIHPITILSTLPSAGVGALLALLCCGTDLSVIALIGIILLIGIVKKNAIMMIDFAIAAERNEGKPPREAIYEACLLRFRPIMMTTMCALLGAVPLAFGTGTGSELRRPLGIAIVGGLLISQLLTLYTTPVVYLYMERFSRWIHGKKFFRKSPAQPKEQTSEQTN
jgi:multidrug efflux pump